MNRNTRQLDLLIAQSNRAKSRMIFWFLVAVMGAIGSVNVWFNEGLHPLMFGLTVSAMMGGFFIGVIEAFNYSRYNGMMWEFFEDDDGPDMPTHNNPMFESDVRPPRMMVQTSHNQWLLSKYKNINERQWWALYDALVNYDGLWSRDRSLKMAGIFTADDTGIILGATGVYPELRDDFRRMGIIAKRGGSWYVTEPDGWNKLMEMAGV